MYGLMAAKKHRETEVGGQGSTVSKENRERKGQVSRKDAKAQRKKILKRVNRE